MFLILWNLNISMWQQMRCAWTNKQFGQFFFSWCFCRLFYSCSDFLKRIQKKKNLSAVKLHGTLKIFSWKYFKNENYVEQFFNINLKFINFKNETLLWQSFLNMSRFVKDHKNLSFRFFLFLLKCIILNDLCNEKQFYVFLIC